MRHIFDHSPGFSLDDIFDLEHEPWSEELIASEAVANEGAMEESAQEAWTEPESDFDAVVSAEPEGVPSPVSGSLELANKISPQTLTRFSELWNLRTQASDARLIQAKALLYCALPYRRTSERSITRSIRLGRTRRVTITLAATEDGVELPYGSDRTVLAWLQTRAYERGVVELKGLTEFFSAFHLRPSGREYQRLKESLRRLAGLAILLERTQGLTSIRRQLTPFARTTSADGNTRPSRRRNPEGSGRARVQIPLDPDFWHYLQANPVALSFDLLRAFRQRPKAWDLATFVLHRCAIAKAPSVVPWPDLVEQLGTLDQSPRRLRRTLARVLDEIRVVHPEFPARFERGGGLLVGPWGRQE